MASAVLQKDGYKADHRRQYPKNTVKVYTNFTPRKSRVPGVNYVINFGITSFIKEFLLDDFKRTFFDIPKERAVSRYKRRLNNYLPGNEITYEHIEHLHDLQYLPLKIKSLPEGALVPCGVPVMTMTNTLPEFFWLPNFLETVLSCELWGMSTSATTAFQYRLIFDKYAMITTGSTEFSSTFQAHDFSFRGQMCRQAAAKNGAAHLTAFRGTDTIPAIDFLEDYYGADSDKELVGASIAATEHSVMCMGTKEAEVKTFLRLIKEVYAKGFISPVSDTWDFWGVVRPKTGILAQLHEEIMARDGRVVIRPDSGDPVKIVTGYTVQDIASKDDYDGSSELVRFEGKLYQVTGNAWSEQGYYFEESSLTEDEVKGAIECLWEEFGGTTTEQGYKVLDTHVGLIYGDSITTTRADEICQRLIAKGFASTNWVAGVGSYTYQYVTRDTFGWAMKATYGEIGHDISTVRVEEDGRIIGIIDDGYLDGETELVSALIADEFEPTRAGVQTLDFPIQIIEPREIFKDPITDDGTKKSAKGYILVEEDAEKGYIMFDQVTEEQEEGGALLTLFEDGELLIDTTLAEIRARVDTNVHAKLN